MPYIFGRRRRHGLQRLCDDVVRANALHPELRAQHEAVRQGGDGDRLDVVRRDEVAPVRARRGNAAA